MWSTENVVSRKKLISKPHIMWRDGYDVPTEPPEAIGSALKMHPIHANIHDVQPKPNAHPQLLGLWSVYSDIAIMPQPPAKDTPRKLV